MAHLTAKQAKEISDFNKTFEAQLKKVLDAIETAANKGDYTVEISLQHLVDKSVKLKLEEYLKTTLEYKIHCSFDYSFMHIAWYFY